jgi:hypothetical protein
VRLCDGAWDVRPSGDADVARDHQTSFKRSKRELRAALLITFS